MPLVACAVLAPTAVALLGAATPYAAHAQKPATPPAPKTGAPPGPASVAGKSANLTPTRPGVYSFWTVSKTGAQSAVGNIAAGQKSAPVTLGSDASEIDVLDEATGTLAVYPAASVKSGATVSVAPGDFIYVKSVQVAVTANGGKAVEKASVTLTDAKNKTVSRVLTAADGGVARFDTVPVGKASVSASVGDANSGGPKVTQETTIAPPKGGEAVQVSLALSGSVPTLTNTPATSGANNAAQTPTANAPVAAPNGQTNFPAVDNRDANPPNNWIPGVVGILLLAGGIFYGLKYAKDKGTTIPSVLKQLGVEMPQDAPATNAANLKPAPPVLPPLASLTELPAAGAASGAVAASFGGSAGAGSAAPAAIINPRLVGLVGPVGGETFPLDSGPLTVGRDAGNTLALTQDTTLSRKHARIESSGPNNWAVTDAGSSNGTFVNGQKVSGSQTLRVGDEIQIGASRFRFEA